jgi:hypothetical protein
MGEKYKIQEKNIRYRGKHKMKAQNIRKKGKDQVVFLYVLIRVVRRGVLYIKILFCK